MCCSISSNELYEHWGTQKMLWIKPDIWGEVFVWVRICSFSNLFSKTFSFFFFVLFILYILRVYIWRKLFPRRNIIGSSTPSLSCNCWGAEMESNQETQHPKILNMLCPTDSKDRESFSIKSVSGSYQTCQDKRNRRNSLMLLSKWVFWAKINHHEITTF